MVYSKCISLLSSPPVRYQASYCLQSPLYGGCKPVGTTPGLPFRALLRSGAVSDLIVDSPSRGRISHDPGARVWHCVSHSLTSQQEALRRISSAYLVEDLGHFP